MEISHSCSNQLFNVETKDLYAKFLDENTDAVPQKELIKYLCAKSWDNSDKARRHGKRNVRYCPIMIKFASYLKSKAGNAAYSFLTDVFTFPAVRTIDSCATLGSNLEDGVLYNT